MNKKIRFAIAGCGVIGKLHAQQVSQIDSAEITAFADIIPERADSYAAEFGGTAYHSFTQMLRDPNIDAVCICTPSGLHGEMAIAAAKHGKHVIVEKPMDINLEMASAMTQACREANVKLACIFQHRFDPATVRVKRYLDEGRFGRLVLVNAHVHWYRSDAYYSSGDWRGTWALDGGGVLMNQAIHTVDLLQYLGGKVTGIFAHTRNLLHPSIEVEDVSSACVEFASGAIGSITATTCAYPGLTTRVEIIGEHGSCIIENDELVYQHFKSDAEAGTHGLAYSQSNQVEQEEAQDTSADVRYQIYGNSHYYQFLDFIAALNEERDPAVTGEEGRHALEIILAIYRSAQEQRRVSLPLQAVRVE